MLSTLDRKPDTPTINFQQSKHRHAPSTGTLAVRMPVLNLVRQRRDLGRAVLLDRRDDSPRVPPGLLTPLLRRPVQQADLLANHLRPVRSPGKGIETAPVYFRVLGFSNSVTTLPELWQSMSDKRGEGCPRRTQCCHSRKTRDTAPAATRFWTSCCRRRRHLRSWAWSAQLATTPSSLQLTTGQAGDRVLTQ